MTRQTLLFSAIFLAAAGTVSASNPDVFSNITTEDIIRNDETGMPEKWDFNDCIDWAINNSTEIRQVMLSILQADENIGEAKDAWLPTVGFSTNQNFTNYPSPGEGRDGNTYGSSYGINAAWTVWEGNVRKYRMESAKLLKQQQYLAGDEEIRNLKLGILQTYLNIMYAHEAVAIARQTLETSTSQTERARRLMESGRTSKVDYAQIESQMAQDQYNLVQAETNYATAKMELKKLLSIGIDHTLEIEEVVFQDEAVNEAVPTMEKTYTLAAAWLPGLKSNELSKEIYDNDVKIAKAGNYPTISLQGGLGTGYTSGGPGWGSQMKNSFNENVGLQLSVPIYDGNATRRAVAKAKLAALEYDLNKEDMLDNLQHTIESLYIDSRNAKAKYISGLKQLEATQLTATLVDRQFELGLVNPLELLTAHNNLLNARLELLQSKYMAILSNKTINYYATQEVKL